MECYKEMKGWHLSMNVIQIHEGSHGFVWDIQQIYIGNPRSLIMRLRELFGW